MFEFNEGTYACLMLIAFMLVCFVLSYLHG